MAVLAFSFKLRLIILTAFFLVSSVFVRGAIGAEPVYCWSRKGELITVDPREFVANQWQVVVWNVDKRKYISHFEGVDCFVKTLRLVDESSKGGATVTLSAANDLTYSVDTSVLKPKAGYLSPVLLSMTLAPEFHIWRDGRQINASFQLAIRSYHTRGKALGYVSLVMLFRDQTTKHPFWFSVQLWDPRGYGTPMLSDWPAMRRTFTMIDRCVTCTSLPHILTAVGEPDDLATSVRLGAATAVTYPLSGIAFDLIISKDQFAQAVDRIRAMPSRKDSFTADPANYTLDIIAIQFESWSGSDTSVAWDVSVNKLKVGFDQLRRPLR